MSYGTFTLTWRAWLSTIFNLAYTLSINGTVYTASDFADMVYSISCDKGGIQGIATGCLTFRLYSAIDIDLTKGTAVLFSGVNTTFYIDKADKNGHIYNVTAYDKCKNVDREFDTSEYSQYDAQGNLNTWTVAEIVGDIAHQCGFPDASVVMHEPTELYFNDFHGKTCRQILDELSVANAGCFFDRGANLIFSDFSKPSSGTVINASQRTDINVKNSKSINGVYACYGLEPNVESATGTAGSRIDMSGRYTNSAAVTRISGIINSGGSWTWYEWSVSSAVVQAVSQLGTAISYSGKLLLICSMRYRFGADIIAEFSAGSAPVDTYKTKTERQIGYCLRRDENNGGVQITRECGLVLVPTVSS